MTASEMLLEIRKARNVLERLEVKYVRQEIQYKTIGASSRAIKANAERQELVREALGYLIRVEQKYLLRAVKDTGRRRSMQFTIPITIPNRR